MLESPLLSLLIRLALPNFSPFAAFFVLVSVDAFVVGRLGRDALAGLSLVFPFVMLSQTMAAGGLGSAVAAAVARSLGGGDHPRARRLALNGVLVAMAISGGFAAVVLVGASAIFSAMGATDNVLDNAVRYATVVFVGGPAPWVLNVTASIMRGAGDMKRPALALGISAVAYLVLSPALTLGLGPFGGLGIVGTGLAFVVSYSLGTAVLLTWLFSSRAALRLEFRGFAVDGSALREILTVGILGGANAILSSVTALVATAFIAHLGPINLAGYGLGVRLEYLVVPLSFAFGTSLVSVVGANIGVGNFNRAKRAAWIGAGLAGTATACIGALAAVQPHWWLRLFTRDGDILAAGATYLTTVGPFYGFFGLGLALYFAAIGAGRPALPVAATALRLAIVSAGLYWGMHSFSGACTVLAMAFAVYGLMIALGTMLRSWRPATL